MIEFWYLALVVLLVSVYWAGRRSGSGDECQKHHWSEPQTAGVYKLTDNPIDSYLQNKEYQPWDSSPLSDFRSLSDWYSRPDEYYGVYEKATKRCVHDGCDHVRRCWVPSTVVHRDELKGDN